MYIKTKLSQESKDVLLYIYNELEQIHISSAYQPNGNGKYHALKTGVNKQKSAKQTCFGIVNYKNKKTLSKSSKLHPEMMYYFKYFIETHYPKFKFNSVYVNKNTICDWHLDSQNVGETLLIGLGLYTGGQTVLKINDKELKFHIKNQSLIFNGSEIEHKSLPFKGTRYSLVFYNTDLDG